VLAHNLVDNVRKHGCLPLNVGARSTREVPEPARECLLGIGRWLEVNGEAICGTTPGVAYGEGPALHHLSGSFRDRHEVEHGAQDVRFTTKGNVLCATCLGWPGEQVAIESRSTPDESDIVSVRLLGVDAGLEWSLTCQGLRIIPAGERPCEHAYVFEIARPERSEIESRAVRAIRTGERGR
jgi:alpha-L-fucosidase